MTDLEKAIRYTCLFATEDKEAMASRYQDIEAMVHGDEEMIQRKLKKYEKMLDFLGSL